MSSRKKLSIIDLYFVFYNFLFYFSSKFRSKVFEELAGPASRSPQIPLEENLKKKEESLRQELGEQARRNG